MVLEERLEDEALYERILEIVGERTRQLKRLISRKKHY